MTYCVDLGRAAAAGVVIACGCAFVGLVHRLYQRRRNYQDALAIYRRSQGEDFR
jgi:hypothetical protein